MRKLPVQEMRLKPTDFLAVTVFVV